MVIEMGAITPPIGINVYVVHGVFPEIPLGTIFRGIAPFTVPIATATIIIACFPQIATFLPSLIRY